MMTKNKIYHKTKVITRNQFVDMWNFVRNFLGFEMPSYAKGIDDAITKIFELLRVDGFKVSDPKISINELTNGGIMITVYGVD